MKNVTKANITFTFMVTLYLLVIFVVRLIPENILPANTRLILPELIMLVPAYLYVVILKPQGLETVSYERPSVMNTFRIVLFTLLLIPAISVIVQISGLFVRNRAGDVVSSLMGNPIWLNMILLAVIPAICEEYIFRGLLFNGYKKRNPMRAMLMSSFLFGLIHMNASQFIYAFVMGIILCLLVYATGTVMSSIIAHFVFNGYNVIISYLAADIIDESSQAAIPSMEQYIIVYAVMAIFAILGIIGAYVEFKKICKSNRGISSVKLLFSKEKRKLYDENQGKFFDGYIAVGIALCVIYILEYGL